MSDDPPFKVIEALEKLDHNERVRRFLAHPATQMAIGEGLKAGVGMERSKLSKRARIRSQQPALFPDIVEAEAQADEATALALKEQAERADQMLNAGRRRTGFAIVKP